MTRVEHMAWCKERAIDYLDRGEITNAIASMVSDLGKHDETARSRAVAVMTLLAIDSRDREQVRKWIDGFN